MTTGDYDVTKSILTPDERAGLIRLAQELVRIRSYSGQEEEAIRFIASQMEALGYDRVRIDSMGNVLGTMGAGGRSVHFDSHIDTVEVKDPDEWRFPPFSGDMVDGSIYGRGSVDMKSGAAASMYAGVAARRLGLTENTTIHVSCTVFEEDCDGENLKHMYREFDLKPDFVVVCEPSSNTIVTGHKGKAQVVIKTRGVAAHGSAPEKGKNAIYEMAEIIQRVEQANLGLKAIDGMRGSLVMSRVYGAGVSLNAVPAACEAYLDRRMVPGETEAGIRAEMDRIIAGKDATWEIGTLRRRSWTGMEITYEPLHTAWKIGLDHELTRACITAYEGVYGSAPASFGYWDFSTNAVTPVSMGIPTIGFGPGDDKLAHMRDEHCPAEQVIAACEFYTRVIGNI